MVRATTRSPSRSTRFPKPLAILRIALRIVLAPGPIALADAGIVGMIADDGTDTAVVFDEGSGAVLATVPVGPGIVGDCSITSDQSLGFVTDFNGRVWVLDLGASPPALAQPSPIPIANPGEDTALSHDDRFLIVCDGLGADPISVVDVATRAQVSQFFLGSNCSSVDVCADGSVLVASSNTGRVHRLLLDSTGVLTHTGEQFFIGSFSSFGPNNVVCAPDAASGIVVSRARTAEAISFLVPGLVEVDRRRFSGTGIGISGEIRDGRAFVRSESGAVDVFGFDSPTAALSLVPDFSFPVDRATQFLGIDQLAVDPSGARIYVPQTGVVTVHDSATGELLAGIHDDRIVAPTGVCFPRVAAARCGDGNLDEGEECDDGNAGAGDGCSADCRTENTPPDCGGAFVSIDRLWPPDGRMEPVFVDGVTDPDGDPVTITVPGILQDEPFDDRRPATCPAAAAAGESVVELRAERRAGGNGRVYRLQFVAEDDRGASCEGEVPVCVPTAANGPRSVCVDDGALFDATGPCR